MPSMSSGSPPTMATPERGSFLKTLVMMFDAVRSNIICVLLLPTKDEDDKGIDKDNDICYSWNNTNT